MYGLVRVGDFVLKICPFRISGPVLTGSKTTFINNKPLALMGSKTVPGMILTGSKSRFVDGKPVARCIDKVFCGKIMTCSKDTFVS